MRLAISTKPIRINLSLWTIPKRFRLFQSNKVTQCVSGARGVSTLAPSHYRTSWSTTSEHRRKRRKPWTEGGAAPTEEFWLVQQNCEHFVNVYEFLLHGRVEECRCSLFTVKRTFTFEGEPQTGRFVRKMKSWLFSLEIQIHFLCKTTKENEVNNFKCFIIMFQQEKKHMNIEMTNTL